MMIERILTLVVPTMYPTMIRKSSQPIACWSVLLLSLWAMAWWGDSAWERGQKLPLNLEVVLLESAPIDGEPLETPHSLHQISRLSQWEQLSASRLIKKASSSQGYSNSHVRFHLRLRVIQV